MNYMNYMNYIVSKTQKKSDFKFYNLKSIRLLYIELRTQNLELRT